MKQSAPQEGFAPPIRGGNAGRVTFKNYPLKAIVRDAYGIKDYQVEGPSWIARERYDIIATKPPRTTATQVSVMMQSLLQERFHLVVHMEKKEMPAYSLLAGKDVSKLRPAVDVPEVAGCQSSGTLSEFADILAHNLNRPVLNQTGIPGNYYFILVYSNLENAPAPDGVAPPPPPPPSAPPPCPEWSVVKVPSPAASIFEAVKEQMGLRLERKGTAVVDVLVVDRAEKVPERN